jgi:hypothetical protein
MLLVYEYQPDTDRVVILTVQDARSSSAATSALPGPDIRRSYVCAPEP